MQSKYFDTRWKAHFHMSTMCMLEWYYLWISNYYSKRSEISISKRHSKAYTPTIWFACLDQNQGTDCCRRQRHSRRLICQFIVLTTSRSFDQPKNHSDPIHRYFIVTLYIRTKVGNVKMNHKKRTLFIDSYVDCRSKLFFIFHVKWVLKWIFQFWCA